MIYFTVYIFSVTFLLCTSLYLGIYVFRLSPESKAHRYFFLSTLSLALIYMFLILIHLFENMNQIWFIYRTTTTLFFIFLYLVLLFLIYLTRLYRFIIISHIILAFCIIAGVVTMISGQYIMLGRTGGLLIINDALRTPAFWINPVYYSIVLLLYIFILISGIVETRLKREKSQYIMLFLTLIINLTVVMIFLLYLLGRQRIAIPVAPVPFFLFIFIAGCWHGITRYRMLAITPENVSRDVLANINESIILLGNDRKIITANDAAKTLLSIPGPEGSGLEEIIPEYKKINKEMSLLFNSAENDFTCRIHFTDTFKSKIPVEARFSVVRDKFGEAIGILIIAKEVKEINRLKTIFSITDREAEIIENIIMGTSNSETARMLGISTNTLKQHITNIYTKLNIHNKVQLISLLREFKLIPEQKAKKTLLF